MARKGVKKSSNSKVQTKSPCKLVQTFNLDKMTYTYHVYNLNTKEEITWVETSIDTDVRMSVIADLKNTYNITEVKF